MLYKQYILFIFCLDGVIEMAKESAFQAKLIKDIKAALPESIVLKTDATYMQGFPDLLILNRGKWAALECKARSTASHQPNQDWYVEQLSGMSYAAFIYPENKERILNELYEALGSRR